MDFKVAGTESGITALQMDIKIQGITADIMESALVKAKTARNHILGIMNQAISAPKELSENAPAMKTFMVNKDKIISTWYIFDINNITIAPLIMSRKVVMFFGFVVLNITASDRRMDDGQFFSIPTTIHLHRWS